jgi:hypothetical protein
LVNPEKIKQPLTSERQKEKSSPNSSGLNRVVGDIKEKGRLIINRAFGTRNGPSQENSVSPNQQHACKTPPPETNEIGEKRGSIVEQGMTMGKELIKKLQRIRKNTMDD